MAEPRLPPKAIDILNRGIAKTESKPDETKTDANTKKGLSPIEQAIANAIAVAQDVSEQSDQIKSDEERKNAARIQLAKYWNDGQVINKIIAGDHFAKNEINQYINTAYHWRLYAMPDRDFLVEGEGIMDDVLKFYERIDSYKQVTIAETGVTGYNISNVEMNTVFGNTQSRSTKTTEISMNIKESNGVAFLDSLQAAADSCGIQNYNDFFYYLELTFKGYNVDGGIENRLFTDAKNGGRWLWPVKINNIDVNLGSGGGDYKLSMIPLSNQTLDTNSEYGRVFDSVSIRARTVKEFFDQFAISMDKSWEERLFAQVVTHSFKFHGGQGITRDSVENMSLTPEEEDFNPVTGNSITFIDPDDPAKSEEEIVGSDDVELPTIFIPKGTPIPDIINTVFSSCEVAQDLAKDSSARKLDADDSPDSVNGKGTNRETCTWQVIPEVRFKGVNAAENYDSLSNRYYRHIIWHVYPRISQEPILSETQIEASLSESVQRSSLAALAGRGFLFKRYDYLFTGKNTEILNFDLNFNFTWSVTLPRFKNYYHNQPIDHALYNNKKDENWGRLFEQNARAKEEGQSLSDEIKELEKSEDSGIDTEIIIAKKRLEQERAKRIEKETADQIKEARKRTTVSTQPEQNYAREFAESIKDQPIKQRLPTIPISLSSDEGAKGDAGFGSMTQYHAGKTIYGTILNQTYGPVTTKFQEIDLTIRGDPFWIGMGEFEEQIYSNKELVNTETHQNTDTNANVNDPYFNGKLMFPLHGFNCFMLTFKYPIGTDEVGNIQLKANETITGIYSVTEVKSRFSDAEFTQELHAVRLPLIDLQKAMTPVPDDENKSTNNEEEDINKKVIPPSNTDIRIEN